MPSCTVLLIGIVTTGIYTALIPPVATQGTTRAPSSVPAVDQSVTSSPATVQGTKQPDFSATNSFTRAAATQVIVTTTAGTTRAPSSVPAVNQFVTSSPATVQGTKQPDFSATNSFTRAAATQVIVTTTAGVRTSAPPLRVTDRQTEQPAVSTTTFSGTVQPFTFTAPAFTSTTTETTATRATAAESPPMFAIDGCPDGWYEVRPRLTRRLASATYDGFQRRNCLKFFSEAETFSRAQAKCRGLNSFLVRLDNVAVSDLSAKAGIITGQQFWTGIYKENNRFYWDDVIPSEVLSYSSFCNSQEVGFRFDYGWGCRGLGLDGCVSANLTTYTPRREPTPIVELRSESCQSPLPYFCYASYSAKYYFIPDPACGESWVYNMYNYVSYKYFDARSSGSFMDAYRTCEMENSSLGDIETNTSMTILVSLLSGRAASAYVGQFTYEGNRNQQIPDAYLANATNGTNALSSLLPASGMLCGVLNLTSTDAFLDFTRCSLPLPFICQKPCSNQTGAPTLTFAKDTGLLTCRSQTKYQREQFWTRNGYYLYGDIVMVYDDGSSSVYASSWPQLASYSCGVFDDKDPSRRIWSDVILVDGSDGASALYRAVITLNTTFNEDLLGYAYFLQNPLSLRRDITYPVAINWVQIFGTMLGTSVNATSYQQQITDIRPTGIGTITVYLLMNWTSSAGPIDPEALQLASSAILSNVSMQFSALATEIIFRDPFFCLQSSSFVLPSGKNASLPKTLAGQLVHLGTCGSKGTIACSGNFSVGAFWDIPSWYLNASSRNSDCISSTLDNITQHDVNIFNIFDVIKKLTDLTESAEGFTATTMFKTAQIVSKVASFVKKFSFNESLLVIPKLLGIIVSNVMDAETGSVMASQSRSNVSFQESLEVTLLWLAEVISSNATLASIIDPGILSLSAANLAFQVDPSATTTGFELGDAENGSTLQLLILNASTANFNVNVTKLLLGRSSANNSKVFLAYGNAKLFQPLSTKWKAMPQVLSAQLYPFPRWYPSTETAVTVTFTDIAENNITRRLACGFWNFSSADWSFSGCDTTVRDDNIVVCKCSHLTNFAVMLDTSTDSIDPVDEHVLTIISYIGLGVSIVALAAVIISFIAFKNMRKTNSQKVLFNLSLSLISLDIVFVAGIDQTNSRGGCIAVAVLLHYFLLTSFSWMLAEAVLQYLNLVKVLGTYVPRFLLKCSIPAWGIPAVIVAIVCGINLDLYRNSTYCFATTVVVWYAVLAPIGGVLIVNIVIYGLVLRSVCCRRRAKQLRSNQSVHGQARLHVQAAIAISVLLGLTWVFGFLQIQNSGAFRLVCMYLFCIFNSIQGLLIFVFHCIREKALRITWKTLCCPQKSLDRSRDMSLDDLWRTTAISKPSALGRSTAFSDDFSSRSSSPSIYRAKEPT